MVKLKNTQINPDDVKKILKYLHRIHGPIFLGNISIEIGYSLLRTERIMEHMFDAGLVRLAKEEELRSIGADYNSIAYVLVGDRNVFIAYE